MPAIGPALPDDTYVLAWPQVLKIAERFPDREAVVAPSARITYAELVGQVAQAQRALTSLDLKPGDRVAAMLGNDWPYLLLYWAVLASGLIYVPLNTKLARPEVADILDHAAPQLVVTDDSLLAQIPESYPGRVVALTQWETRMSQESSDAIAPQALDPQSVALILYTSGTTGRPKGVMLTHKNVAIQFFQSTSTLVSIQPGDRVVALFPLFHSAQHVFLQPPLTVGATVIIDVFSPKKVPDLLIKERITVFFGVPAMYHILLQNETFHAGTFPDIRILTYGASIMPTETIQIIKTRFPRAEIRNLYGQTENSPAISGLDDRFALTKPGSVGLPLPGVTVAIFDDTDQEVASGVVGEVVTQGVNLMKGYYHDENQTQLAVHHGWYHSGDLGYMDDDGFLYVIDRKKDMIIRGGQNIYPAEVENVLYQHSAVVECAVIGVPHEILGEEVHAVITRRAGHEVSPDELHQFMTGRIAAYKMPVAYHFVDELPHNASGKILKRELRTMAREGAL